MQIRKFFSLRRMIPNGSTGAASPVSEKEKRMIFSEYMKIMKF
ncbi:hypothetical protein LEP1GSC193_4367 [Leptospira alstonii serovar Pingchang str. 80-412]|uniref:Uncharacterized protein n=2 Tax=Leptospira alstonii TaxID=28452 RepID=M6CTD5_9LEPT|nr:hypothetical protein LEP1GSC194_1943 [Leptospira alstonii serovar Sichuan str. 79601]EQA80161.1 hypothetical protein LEP1GSC193_4367 [Leptospira alstonii serovar Pingchang str. 80-412]